MNRLPEIIFGIDFSGAMDAGDKIWICTCRFSVEGLSVDAFMPGRDLPHSGRDRVSCHKALLDYIWNIGNCAAGFDFSFSLPLLFLDNLSWTEFILSFPHRFADADHFRQWCLEITGGKELKRITEREARAPFAAYNVRIFRQTYFGMRDILHPFLSRDMGSVLPMQKPIFGKPVFLEICPASILKTLGIYIPYKGSELQKQLNRNHIVGKLVKIYGLTIKENLKQTVINNPGGDALDSLLAALAVSRNLNQSPADSLSASALSEGHIYF